MKEVKKPNSRTFWSATDGVTTHTGYTEINQVTTTGMPTMAFDNDPTYVYPPLPISGTLTEGEVYSHLGKMVIVRQTHERTIFEPSETPALFGVVRANSIGGDWIANEDVIIGDTRVYNGNTYKCIQSHFTLSNWTPDVVPALWQLTEIGTVTTEVWVQPTGAQDAYQIGDTVFFPTETDPMYISLIDANVWSPATYPAGWELVV